MTVRIRGHMARIAADQDTAFWVLLWSAAALFTVHLITDGLYASGLTPRQIGGDMAREYAGHLFVTMLAILRAGGQSIIDRLSHSNEPPEPKP